MNKEKAIENLRLAKEVFNELNIQYWLFYGTLLGAVRENDFILHDNDLDVGMYINDHKDELISKFKEKGFELKKTFGSKNEGLEYALERNSIKLDIFFFYKEKDYIWTSEWYCNKFVNFKILKKLKLVKAKLLKIKYPFIKTKEIKFKGEKFLIPSNSEECLEAHYGKDWKIPKHKFKPQNIIS